MTTTAIARSAKVAQAFLGAKVHDPKDPGGRPRPDVHAGRRHALPAWRRENEDGVVEGARLEGRAGHRRPDAGRARGGARGPGAPAREVRRGQGRAREHLARDPFRARARARSTRRRGRGSCSTTWRRRCESPRRARQIARSLLPLYQLRTASFIEEVRDMTTTQSETVIEDGARVMEEEKRLFLDRRSQDRARSASTA